MKVEILDEAERDLTDGFSFYEAQATGLGDYFLDSLFAGIILGLYRYDNESKSEFRNWSEDVPLDSAGCLLDDWRKRNTDKTVRDSMDALIRERCPDWAKHMIGRS